MAENFTVSLNGWDEAGFRRLPPGGYVCNIVNAYLGNSKNGNKTLYVEVDIAQGDFAGFFKEQTVRLKTKYPDVTWVSNARLSIPTLMKDKIHYRLKNFLVAVKDSNSDLSIEPKSGVFDIRHLIGKSVGCVFRGREAKATDKDGKHYVNTIVAHSLPVQDILDGDFSVPTVEPYVESAEAPTSQTDKDFFGTDVDPSDMPF